MANVLTSFVKHFDISKFSNIHHKPYNVYIALATEPYSLLFASMATQKCAIKNLNSVKRHLLGLLTGRL